MPDPKEANARRQARKRRRDLEEKGIVGVLVKVHHTRRAEIREAAAAMREPAGDAGETPAQPTRRTP